MGSKLAFRTSGVMQHQQQQQQQQQDRMISLMSMMEIPLLQQLPQPPALTYTAPSLCNHTEHAAAAALCLAGTGLDRLDGHLVLLLHRSKGVVPHASHFISKRLMPSDSTGFADVLSAGGGHSAGKRSEDDGSTVHSSAAHDHLEPSDTSAQQMPVALGAANSLESNHAPSSGGTAAAAKKSKNLRAQKQMLVARKLQGAVASQRQTIVMKNGLSPGERLSLQQFHQGKLVNLPFLAAAVHAGRILGCFFTGGSVCTVDCLGWFKWCVSSQLQPCIYSHPSMFVPVTTLRRLTFCLCAVCSKPLQNLPSRGMSAARFNPDDVMFV